MSTRMMSAWRVSSPGPLSTHPLGYVDAAIAEPGEGEVLVAVTACGVCRTDLHVTEGDLPVHRAHVVPGHEVVGEVVGLGSNVGPRLAVGDRVGVGWLRHTCGRCRFCLRGAENLCTDSQYTGWDADGGYAEFVAAPADYVHHLPSGYSDSELAPLLCAGIIGYRSLLRAQLPPGGTLAIAGIHLSDVPAMNYQRHLFQERQVRSVSSNTRADAREFLDFAGRHHIEVTALPYALDRADAALNDVKSGRIAGAAVLIP